MRYLKGILDFKLYLGGKDIVLGGFCDVDWAGDANDRPSSTGYVIFVGVRVILWKYKKQPTIALSMIEVEYMATSHCTIEGVWLRQLLSNVGYVQEVPTSILCNNQGCIALANNPTHHSRTKYIDVQHHFIREKLEYQ